MESENSPRPDDINSINSEINEKPTDAVYRIRKFVTDVWEHPLVDGQTRIARYEGQRKFLEYAKRSNFDSSDYIAIPVGSVLWNVDNKSDNDFQLIINPDKISYQDVGNSDVDYLKENKLHITGVISANDMTDFNAGGYASLTRLIITPDDYLVGDRNFAARLRLNSLERLTALGLEKQEEWHYWMERNFEHGVKEWMNENEDKAPDRSRMGRFQQKLNERSMQTHVPEKWKIAFNDAHRNITLPSLAEFSKCFRDTQGRLDLLESKRTYIA